MKRQRPEDALQRAVAEYLDLALPRGVALWWHTPNGGKRSKATAGVLKAMGVKAGVPDLTFLWTRPGHARPFVGFIELKAGAGVLSGPQKDFRTACKALGAFSDVARSLTEVEMILRRWGCPLRATATARPPIAAPGEAAHAG